MPGMATRPQVIAFDVIETMFPLEPMRQRLTALGLPGHTLELWFARLLRDAFALVATDSYRPFGEIAASALRSTADHPLDDEAVSTVLAGFVELDPHPDVEPAVRLAREAGVRMVTLTNGSARNTAGLLRRAGIDGDIEQVRPSTTSGGGNPPPRSTGTQRPARRYSRSTHRDAAGGKPGGSPPCRTHAAA